MIPTKNFIPKSFCSQKIWFKICWSQKNKNTTKTKLTQTKPKFKLKKLLVEKYFWWQKKFWSKNIFGSKKIWSIFGWNIFLAKLFFGKIFFWRNFVVVVEIVGICSRWSQGPTFKIWSKSGQWQLRYSWYGQMSQGQMLPEQMSLWQLEYVKKRSQEPTFKIWS